MKLQKKVINRLDSIWKFRFCIGHLKVQEISLSFFAQEHLENILMLILIVLAIHLQARQSECTENTIGMCGINSGV